MRRHTQSFAFVATIALLAAVVPGLRAQNAPGAPPQDPGAPERGVARVSIVNGEVSVRRGDSGDWVAAVVNAPLMAEDRVSTGAGARAEVQFDSANLIRLGANAEIRLAELGQNHYHLQVAHGTVSFRVLRESQAKVELDTPTVSVKPLQVGAYRIYVQGDGQTEITVRLGAAEVSTPKGSEKLQAGQTMLARGSPTDPEFQIVPAIARDSWDDWNERRDREMLSSSELQQCAARYVRRGGSGQPWPVGGRTLIWPSLESPGGSGLGALPEWALGLGRLLWLDLGELRPLGLGAVSLWPLAVRRAIRLVLVSRGFWSALLVAGAGGFLRIWTGHRRGFRLWECRLGGAGAI